MTDKEIIEQLDRALRCLETYEVIAATSYIEHARAEFKKRGLE